VPALAKGAEEAAAFLEAMRGVRVLEGRARVVGGGQRPPSHPAAVEARRARALAPAPAAVDALPVTGDGAELAAEAGSRWQLRAPGIDRRTVKRLGAGDLPVEARLDLHGLTRGQAAEALGRFLASARAGQRRALLVIHGRGLHSGSGGPTLTQLVRELLGRGEHAAAVLAAVAAPPRLGGEGATLVWLRRS
jgi:DNA-nicking Smr family endonuclease